ncbi:MAG: Wzz/FepE/Etk N-terminal domain-containing protein [Bacteroidota bacterium]
MSEEILFFSFVRNLVQAVKYLKTKKLTIFLSGLVFAILAATIVYFSSPKYTAKVTFFSDNDKGGKLGGYASIASQFGIDLGMGNEGAFSGDNLIALFKSRVIIEKTLYSKIDSNSKLLLIDQYFINHKIEKVGLKGGISYDLTQTLFSQIDNQRLKDSVVGVICEKYTKENLEIEKIDRKVDIIYVALTENNEVYAKKFTEKMVSNVIDYYMNYKTSKSRNNVEILRHQADSVRECLFGGISTVAALNDLNVNPLKQTPKTGIQKKQTEMQVNAALYTELLKNLEISELTLKKETPLIQVIDRPVLPLKNQKMGRAMGAIIGMVIGCIITCIFLGTRFVLKLLKDN